MPSPDAIPKILFILLISVPFVRAPRASRLVAAP
jgi:hypothetical protein